jgi:sugar lactone lactonase YvrE
VIVLRGWLLILTLVTGSGLAAGADTAVVADEAAKAILRVDPITGDRSVLSDSKHGTGNVSLYYPYSVRVDASGQIIVADYYNGIIRVDPSTGNRVLISSSSRGTGPSCYYAVDLVIDSDGSYVVLVGGSYDYLLRISPSTGRTPASLARSPPLATVMSPAFAHGTSTFQRWNTAR